ncbi:MAG: hypothetical protein ACLPR9_18595 [Acidimicrobiales bacterium]
MKIKSLFSTKKRIAAVALSGAVILGTGGIAAAYFAASGSGSGHASVGAAGNWTVALSSDNSGVLYPGSGSETLNYVITNNGPGALALQSVAAVVVSDGSGNITQGGSDVPNCQANWFGAVASAPNPALGVNIAPTTTATGTVTVTLGESGTNQTGCAGHDPDITLNVT